MAESALPEALYPRHRFTDRPSVDRPTSGEPVFSGREPPPRGESLHLETHASLYVQTSGRALSRLSLLGGRAPHFRNRATNSAVSESKPSTQRSHCLLRKRAKSLRESVVALGDRATDSEIESRTRKIVFSLEFGQQFGIWAAVLITGSRGWRGGFYSTASMRSRMASQPAMNVNRRNSANAGDACSSEYQLLLVILITSLVKRF